MKMHSLNTRLPHGAAVSFRLVSFRNVSSSFFFLSAFNLFCNASLGAQRECGNERGRGITPSTFCVQDVPRKVERNKCRRVRYSQEYQDIRLLASSQVVFSLDCINYVKCLRINKAKKGKGITQGYY